MYISKKKKIIMASIFSFALIVGTGVGSWALVSYLDKRVPPIQKLNLAVQSKTIPLVNSALNSYSSKWMEQYSSDQDFDFSSQEGYDSSLNYAVVDKLAIGNELQITVNLSISGLSNSYIVKLPNEFSTPENSSIYALNNTVIDLPMYESNIKLTSIPPINTPITPSLIAFDSPKFKLIESPNSYIYNVNGSMLKVADTLDSYSIENMDNFIKKYKELSGTNLTVEELKADFEISIANEKTIILFEITNGVNKNGTIITKDFSSSDSSNDVENAPEIEPVLNNPIFPPTAQQIISSGPNFYYYLGFKPESISINSKYSYSINSVKVANADDKLEKSVEVEIIASHNKTGLSKTYFKIVGNLMSVQQKELNDIILESNDWMIPPTISAAYKGKSIDEIIKAPSNEAFSLSGVNPKYEYVVSATEVVINGKHVISVFIEMSDKIDKTAKIDYSWNITEGFTTSK